MTDSISGGRPLTPAEAFQEQQKVVQAEEIDKISLSYDSKNSVSHRKAIKEGVLTPANIHAPSIPAPNLSATPTGDELIAMETQARAHEANFALTNGLEMLKVTQPDLVTPELTNQIGQISNRLSMVESAPPGLMADVSLLSDNLLTKAANKDLDPDMLNQIMSEIQSKMDDNAVKFSEFEIKARSADAQQKHESNIHKIGEYMKEVKEAEEAQSKAEEARKKESSGGGFFSAIKSFFTSTIPAAITGAVEAIEKEFNSIDLESSITSAGSSISSTFKNAFGKVENAFKDFGDETQKAFETFGNNTEREFKRFADNAKSGLEGFGKDTKRAFETFAEDTRKDLESFGRDTKHAFKEFGKDTETAFKKFGKDTETTFKEFGKDAETAFKEFGKDTETAFKEFGKDTETTFKEFGKDTETAFETFVEYAREGLKSSGQDTKEVFETFARDAKEGLKNFGNDTRKAFEQVSNDTKEGFKHFSDTVVDSGKKVSQTFEPLGHKENWNRAGDAILKSIGIEPSSGKPLEGEPNIPSGSLGPTESYSLESEGSMQKVPASDVEVSAAMQGLGISETALSHQEMMKLLQQMKAAGENKEKLEAAIAALESGDLKSLKQIVKGLSGGEAIIALMDNPDTTGLTKSLLDVPAQTARIQEDQKIQNALVSRFRGA